MQWVNSDRDQRPLSDCTHKKDQRIKILCRGQFRGWGEIIEIEVWSRRVRSSQGHARSIGFCIRGRGTQKSAITSLKTPNTRGNGTVGWRYTLGGRTGLGGLGRGLYSAGAAIHCLKEPIHIPLSSSELRLAVVLPEGGGYVKGYQVAGDPGHDVEDEQPVRPQVVVDESGAITLLCAGNQSHCLQVLLDVVYPTDREQGVDGPLSGTQDGQTGQDHEPEPQEDVDLLHKVVDWQNALQRIAERRK